MNPLSGVLDEAWRMYRAHAVHLLVISFVIYLVTAIIVALLALAGEIGSLLGVIVQLVATFLLQAALIKAVQDVRDGRADLSLGETVAAAVPYLWQVAVAAILAGIAITIGLVLLIVPGLILITIWAVIIPAIVIGGSGPLESFGRSQQLVRGHGWNVFGTLVLVFVIMLVVNIVLAVVFALLPLLWRNGLSSVITGTLVAPYLALVVTLIYYRLSAAAAQQGYPGQGGYSGQSGYSGQGGDPGQGGYPNQAGYPPEGGYPAQGGYTAQGGDPSQGGYTAQGGDPSQGGEPPQAGDPPQGGSAP